MPKKKPNRKRASKLMNGAGEFWVIDTTTPGETLGSYAATGPYPTQEAAEEFLIEDSRETWGDSCDCIKSSDDHRWGRPVYIVQVVRKVQPKVVPLVQLVDI